MFNGSLDTGTQAYRIKAIRDALNLSQQAFAERTGNSPALISKLERGERNLTDRMKTSICLTFGVSEKYLMDGVGEMFSNKPHLELINQLAIRFGLSEAEKIFLITYLGLSENTKKACAELLTSFVNDYINSRI